MFKKLKLKFDNILNNNSSKLIVFIFAALFLAPDDYIVNYVLNHPNVINILKLVEGIVANG